MNHTSELDIGSNAGAIAPVVVQTGAVVSLHSAPRAMLPMREFPFLELVEGHGVKGDRYASGLGFLSDKLESFDILDYRQVSFFEQEALDMLWDVHGVRLSANEHRRNVTTRGIDLNAFIGKRFQIGSCICVGSETPPCKHLEEVTGKPIAPMLIRRGGLNAMIVRGGVIKPGDVIQSLPE
ncbi:MAG: MOSC domain-containing protein [Comamonadaceae bacterium]|nr:MOSC domain-containing protein [Comamonadaceae bacterium]